MSGSPGAGATPGDVVEEAPPALARRVFRPQTLLSFLVAFAALYFFYHRGFNLDLREVWARMWGADAAILALAFAVFYCSFLPRSLRWRVLLANVGYSRAQGYAIPSVAGLAEIIFLSWFANCVTIARLGDAYRGFMLKRAAGVSFGVTLGTILAERLMDLAVLALMMSATTLAAFRGALPAEARQALAGGLILSAVGIAGLLSLRRLRPLVDRILPGRLHAHYARLERGVIDSFRRVPLLALLSAFGWLIEGLTFYLTAAAVGAPISLVAAIVVALVAALLTAVPFTPAGLGVAEAGTVLVLGQLGLDPNAAGAVALLNRVITYWSIIGFGLVLYLFSRKK